jgi:hypothetical protein
MIDIRWAMKNLVHMKQVSQGEVAVHTLAGGEVQARPPAKRVSENQGSTDDPKSLAILGKEMMKIGEEDSFFKKCASSGIFFEAGKGNHIIHGEINKEGNAVGMHHFGSKRGEAEIQEIFQNGYSDAKVKISDEENNLIPKKYMSTMFPEGMSIKEALREGLSAFVNRDTEPDANQNWSGESFSGVPFRGTAEVTRDENGKIVYRISSFFADAQKIRGE